VDAIKAEGKAQKAAYKEQAISANRAAKNERRRKHAEEVATALARKAAATQSLDQAMGEESPELAAQALAFFQRVRNKSGCAYSSVLNALLRGEVMP
jgi:ADP-ribosylglycohydrolase